MWYNLGYNESSCLKLLMEMKLWKRNEAPYNLTYNTSQKTPMKWWLSINIQENETDQLQELALLLFSIVPSQAACERNFSMLKWFYGERRMNLNLSKIEYMAKIRSYYISNVDKEIRFKTKNFDEKEFLKNINELISIYDILEKNNILESNENIECEENKSEEDELEERIQNESESSITLNINQFVDLTLPAFLSTGENLFESNNVRSNVKEKNNTEYDPIKLAQRILNEN